MISIIDHSPKLLSEWDYTKNEGINPEFVSYGSKLKAWWICAKDHRHSWQASVGKRTAGKGCPICANLLVVEGINDLNTTHPLLCKEIDETSPLYVQGKLYAAGSDKKIGWRCRSGHTWNAVIRNRTKGQGCPVCSGRTILPGFNDFASRHPKLVLEISKVKNPDFDPNSVAPSANDLIWWKCSMEHEWEATVRSRAMSGSGCPYCRAETWTRKRRGTKATYVPGRDDLAARYPSIALEWHLKLNLPLTPNQVQSSDKNLSIWWTCPQGHSYQNSPQNRVFGSGCKICAGKAVVAGINDFASRNPLLVKEFDQAKNEGLGPSEFTAKSLKKYWWKCQFGHSWSANPAARTKGNGCPVCSNYEVSKGFNDLQTKAPELSNEWDFELNENHSPDSVYFNSTKKYFWICKLRHSYKQSPQSRINGVGCPVCGNRKLLRGFNDLATRYPALLSEWDTEKNKEKNLDSIYAITNTKYFWVCADGHQWSASLANRINGSGCPSCASFGYDPNKRSYFYFIQNQELLAFKVGIANVGAERLNIWKRLKWETLYYVEGSGTQILKLETMILRWIRHELKLKQHLSQNEMRGHKGATETFSMESLGIQEVFSKIEKTKLEAFNDDSKLKRRR